MLRPSTSDPLAIVEAGYNLEVDDAGWVARLTRAIARELAGPIGTVGYRFENEHGLRYRLHSMSVERGDPALASWTVAVVATFPVDDLASFYRQPGITSSRESCRMPMPAHQVERGFTEFCGVVIGSEANGATIGVPLPELAAISSCARRRWRRVAAHLSTLFRLRAAFSLGHPVEAEALLTPDARLLHATGLAAGSAEARRALCAAVIAMEKARGPLRKEDAGTALNLWRELVAGRWTVVEKFESCGRRLLVAHPNPPESSGLRELTPPQNTIVKRLIDGRSARMIASELGTTPGAVSRQVDSALRKLRLGSTGELVTLATRLRRRAAFTRLRWDEMDALVIDAGPTPEKLLALRLSKSERQIAGLVLDGHSTSQIAEVRRTAYRTVANQVASIYQKLGVSSRGELAAFVAGLSA